MKCMVTPSQTHMKRHIWGTESYHNLQSLSPQIQTNRGGAENEKTPRQLSFLAQFMTIRPYDCLRPKNLWLLRNSKCMGHIKSYTVREGFIIKLVYTVVLGVVRGFFSPDFQNREKKSPNFFISENCGTKGIFFLVFYIPWLLPFCHCAW